MKRALLVALTSLAACGPASTTPPPLKPSAATLTVECDARSVLAWDERRMLIPGGGVNCSVHVADRLGRPLDGVRVALMSEAGFLEATEGNTVNGVFTTRLAIESPAPRDVPPDVFSFFPLDDELHTGTPLVPAWMMPMRWNTDPTIETQFFSLQEPRRYDPLRTGVGGQPVLNNPRDNLVTIVAMVNHAEEAFVDVNGNGTRDIGEAFTDLTEPFLDMDDDGTNSLFEPYFDVNEDQQWTGKNKTWDGDRTVWTSTWVVWTGLPHARDAEPTVASDFRSSVVSDSLELTCAADPCEAATALTARAFIADPWFNPLTRRSANDSCRLKATPAIVTAEFQPRGQPIGAQETLEVGWQFTYAVRDVRTAASARRTPGAPFVLTAECDFTVDPSAAPQTFRFELARGTIE
ncbi:MAG: hypothetical protein QM817_39415 [Archangium sp.]